MKNKDGIKSRIGQIWNYEGYRLVGFDSDVIIMLEPDDNDYEGRYDYSLHTLIECPKMGDMRGYTVVTRDQKDKYKRPDCAEWFDDDDNTWNQSYRTKWEDDSPYRVPADFDGWELKEPEIKIQLLHGCKGNGAVCGSGENVFSRTVVGITCPRCYEMFKDTPEEPKPQFKLFEIDWHMATWPIIKEEVHDAIVGQQVDGYRITCFTYCKTLEDILTENGRLNWNNLSDTPLDYNGKKKKYAVGVLEND